MSGSNTVAILTPVVMLPLMAFWLIMVFRADSHPGYRHRPPLPVPDALLVPGPGPAVPAPPADVAPVPEPGVSEQQDEEKRDEQMVPVGR